MTGYDNYPANGVGDSVHNTQHTYRALSNRNLWYRLHSLRKLQLRRVLRYCRNLFIKANAGRRTRSIYRYARALHRYRKTSVERNVAFRRCPLPDIRRPATWESIARSGDGLRFSPILSPRMETMSARPYVIEHVEPEGPSAGLHDQRESGVAKSPSCAHFKGEPVSY